MLLGESGTSGHWDMEEAGIQPYKYGGKEFDSMHGLNLYDFHARRYNSVLGGFDTMDPLAEKGYQWSPYVYCFNNPMKYVDPDGKWSGLAQIYYGTNAPATVVQQQKAEAVKIDAAIPSAVSVNIGGSLALIGGVSKDISITLTLRGDKGPRIHVFESNTFSIGTPELSLKLGANMTHSSNPDNFSGKDMTGASSSTSAGISEGPAGVSATYSEGKTDNGDKITTRGVVVSGGASGAVNISNGKTITTETLPSMLINSIIDTIYDEK